MTASSISPALRAAVDASLSWYDALCALHGVPCGIEDDVWRAYAPPPPLHSAAKTVEPTARPDHALAAVGGAGGIADSFGAFDLSGEGFQLLFEAQWIHRPAPAVNGRRLPASWDIVRTEPELRAWTSRHDTQDVLLPALLQRSSFRVIGKRAGDGYAAGAVLHLCAGVVDVSNVWATSDSLDWSELVSAAAALFPGRALVGYEYGPDLERAAAAGFAALGPQRVWVR
ncbi:MAG: hypothetical protein ABWY56_16720 [Propionibacteriaceae bacterium]